MCTHCYEKILDNWPKNLCLACGGPLPEYQVSNWTSKPQELSNGLHVGPCANAHWALAGIVLGVPFRTRRAIPYYGAQTHCFQFPSFKRDVPEEGNLVPARPLRKVKLLGLPR